MRRGIAFQEPAHQAGSVPSEFSRFCLILHATINMRRCWRRGATDTQLVKSAAAPDRDAPGRLDTSAEAPVTLETESVISLKPEMDDLVPSEASSRQLAGDPADLASFPKVLRRRLDKFFADSNISPKADRTMWVKIAAGLAVLAGSWIAIYAFKPNSWKFVALYLLGGLAQTFLLLNIAHDSNHNAISSVPSVNKTLNYVFDVCGINSYMWRILHHRGHHSQE